MANKQIEIFEHDYDQLMLRAGHPDKIKYVVKHLVALTTLIHQDRVKLQSWLDAAGNIDTLR